MGKGWGNIEVNRCHENERAFLIIAKHIICFVNLCTFPRAYFRYLRAICVKWNICLNNYYCWNCILYLLEKVHSLCT